ncbi:MAG TPA: transcription-repair coupling factor [Anaerolineaceae bacterium]|nr:transcription-repair coupling factor [Anaerolineaceae bacterium]
MIDLIRNLLAFKQLIADLEAPQALPGLGLMRSARLPVTAALAECLHTPILYIVGRTDQALTLWEEIAFWRPGGGRYYFPEPNPLFYEQASWGNNTRRERLQSITALAGYHIPGYPVQETPPVVVAPVRAVMSRTLPRRDFLRNSRTYRLEQQHQPDTLARSWAESGYATVDIVVEPGQFSRRGGILDIWPPHLPNPVRFDFFGDEIDTLRMFDPATQRTIRALESILVTPAREILPGYVKEDLALDHELSEFDIPLVHPAQASLLDYLPKNSLVLLDDLNYLETIANEIEEQSVRFRQESIQEGVLPENFPVPYLTWSEIVDSISRLRSLELGYTTAVEESLLGSLFTPGERYAGHLKELVESLDESCTEGNRITIVSRQVTRLKELWLERNARRETACSPVFIEGTLTEGWNLKVDDTRTASLLTDGEVFGWERPRPRQRPRPAADNPESSYTDFRIGDWVVHIDYGVGRFGGLVQRTLDGVSRELLMVEYDRGDQVFVPVHQADRLTRYVGADNETPTPTRLGTQEWHTARQRVKEGVQEVARDLLELYASRMAAQGYAFSPDTPWQQELEASFPYTETEDQAHAIKEVKKDMEFARPMDRLLCGDVGYGKTEVALRAAFKAVMDSRQVAVLVPTTVLAQQHYETFRQRLAAYPVEVEMLSRFRNPKEQSQILKKLNSGGVDIVIGTHRLVQSDVQFKDLGLVIIDEEQRFGVTHKEYLKKLRTEVDVLTLTATPIPRTLYMALTGVRDISTINTPPEERLPIVTHIGPYSPKLVRQAILRELERGGQVFFVHNRVQTIEAMKVHLNKLVPEARVGIGHGQMHEQDLAKVMMQFTHGEIDVLLCTSIIESGLDIPNANTLIVDRGDTFGLAQLYQLRGRVGRGALRAYAYFFRHRKKAPTPEGQERLEIIAENTQLGAGYSIAMRDLEMRGAGELLGTRQHGYIASVGFHLYTRMLAQAVRDLRRLQGLEVPAEMQLGDQEMWTQVNVDLPLSIGIPIEYVPDQNLRLRLYRRLADIKSERELEALQEEFQDRFGTLPDPVKELLYQTRVKLLAEEKGLVSVLPEAEQLVLRYPVLINAESTSRQLPSIGHGSRVGKNAYWLSLVEPDENWKERLVEVLKLIPAEDQTIGVQRELKAFTTK